MLLKTALANIAIIVIIVTDPEWTHLIRLTTPASRLLHSANRVCVVTPSPAAREAA